MKVDLGIAFGKHKGRSVWEARENRELREWLEWLARSSNARSAAIGRWYLRQLATAEPEAACVATWGTGEAGPDAFAPQGAAIVVYEHPELPRLRVLVDAARARLAELEAACTIDKARVDSLQADLFRRLRKWHQERDRLRLVVNDRQQFLEVLLRQGEEEAEEVEQAGENAQ
jgi:DNA polymerase-3 subunit epsilon